MSKVFRVTQDGESVDVPQSEHFPTSLSVELQFRLDNPEGGSREYTIHEMEVE